MSHARTFLDEVVETARRIEPDTIEALCDELASLRDRQGRLFIIGVGGSAGNCGHAVNDFRKLCGIEAYAPTDNVSELTARTNDESWPTVFSEWLKVSRANAKDRQPKKMDPSLFDFPFRRFGGITTPHCATRFLQPELPKLQFASAVQSQLARVACQCQLPVFICPNCLRSLPILASIRSSNDCSRSANASSDTSWSAVSF